MQTQLYLTPADHGRPLTLEEFEHAAGQEGHHYEIIEGRLEVSPLPEFWHEYFRKMIERLFDHYIANYPHVLAWVQAPARVFVPGRPEATAPEPDVAVYDKVPKRRPDRIRWQDLHPVLVVEILSPDSADKDLVRNRRLYWAVPSIREYWIVDPRQDAAHPLLLVYRRGRARWLRALRVPADQPYTTAMLPGFALRLEDLMGGLP